MPVIQLGILFFSILFLVVPLISGAPDGISKRAHILPPKSNNSSNIQRHADNANNTSGQSITTASLAGGVKDEICPSHLVAHNVSDVTVCCIAIFNCPVGHGIIPCKKDGEMDSCVPCPQGMLQTNNVSSLNMEEADCYSEKNTENCPLDDTKPSRKYSEVISCLLKCECKNEECWYGKDPCACNLSNPCPINYTMNRETGECEKCPWYSYKDYVGCGTCTVIPQKWRARNEHPTTAVDTDKKTTVEESTQTADEQILDSKETRVTSTASNVANQPTVIQNNDVAIVLVVVFSILIVVIIVGVIIYLRKRRKNAGSQSQRLENTEQNRHNEQDLELGDKTPVVEIPDGYKTVGEGQKLVPKVNKRIDEGKQIPYEELGAVGGGEAPVDNNPGKRDDSFGNKQVMFADASHENVPLLERRIRQKQNISNLALGSGMISDAEPLEQSPLLNDFKDGLGETEAIGGARPKIAAWLNKRKTKSESSIVIKKYKDCTFLNCNIDNNTPPISEDSSLITDESSDFSSTEPNIKMPVKVRNVSNKVIEKHRQSPHREEGGYKAATQSVPELSMKVINNDFAEYRTTDTNGSEISDENNTYGDKHLHINERELNNLDRLTESKSDNPGLKVQNDKENCLGRTDGRENKEYNYEKTDTENDDNTTISNEVCANGTVSQELKNMMKKEELSESDRSSRSSEGDDDDHRSGNRKIRPFCSSSNSGKPTAIIGPLFPGPVRQNSVQESGQRIISEPIQNSVPAVSLGSHADHQASFGLYIESLGSDSYPILHANHPPNDIANINDIHSLSPETISTNESSSMLTESVEGNLWHPREQRQGPEGSSMPQTFNGESYVQRPDLQRTYSKYVESDNIVVDNVARNLNEETLLKTPVLGPASDTTADKNSVCKTQNNESDSDMDEIDAEKRKNSETVRDIEQCTEKVKEGHGEAHDTNIKDHELEKSEGLVKTASSENDVHVETVGESDSVELPFDCLTNTEDSSSVEIDLINSFDACDGSLPIEEDKTCDTGATVNGNDKKGDSES